MTSDVTQDPVQMFTFDLHDSTTSHGSFKKKMVFPEDRVGATCILHVLYPELQAVAGWTKPGYLGDYFYIKYNYCDEKSKFNEKIEEEYIRDEYFLTKA